MDKNIVPAPWKLQGRGFIFVYKFSKSFIKKYGFFSEETLKEFKGGFGSIMIVQYNESNAGPYDELLFIPGKVHIGNQKNYTITKIYVSTQISVDSGRENWGIPKELAHFSFETLSPKKEIIRVGKENQIFFEAEVSHSLWKFPVNTKYLPISLHQHYKNKIFITKFNGKGKASFAKIHNINIIPDYFPPVGKPISGLYIEPFELEFPVAIIKE
ncbi:MAG: hypothetical protein KatS3mg129_1555 [Leptospiraceae bacterium]|nr:MAG: hypothetical protein KatS3mg129_1555 [Leptospiraceae bacterium]